MNSPDTFVFAGGGSGGHLFPGIAVADELKRRDPTSRIVFVGSTRPIESSIVSELGLEHRTIPVEPLPTLRRNPLRFLWRNWQSWRQAMRLLNELRPSAVIGLGGFASAPLVLAARRRRIPVILLEQNVIPGRTTRWLSRLANHVCVSFDQTASQVPHARRITVTGNPVRREIAEFARSVATHSADRTATRPELLILGGSQGADSLNEAVLAAVRRIRDSLVGWNLAHQTGPRQVDSVRLAYEQSGLPAIVEPFFHDMPQRYSKASLVVSRAGGTTLAELACAAIPMILIPYPHAADDHQQANARHFVDHNAAVLIGRGTGDDATQFGHALKTLVEDREARTRMGWAARHLARPDAAKQVASVILSEVR